MSYPGWIVSLGVPLPNAAFMAFPPKSIPEFTIARSRIEIVMEIFERVGQVGVFAIPFFYRIEVTTLPDRIALGVMLAALAFYYVGWVRFFANDRRYELLFRSMLGIPLPMAVAPIAYFAAASVVLHSWPSAVAAAVFAVGHLSVAGMDHDRCRCEP